MRPSVRFLIFAVLAVAVGGAAIGTAGAGSEATGDPPSREKLYLPGMSLQEQAKAASGTPGRYAPPCPDVAAVDALKKAGIPFGPCDPTPEDGAPVLLPLEEGPEPETSDEAVCPGTILGKGVDLRVMLPCAVGAEFTSSDAVRVDGDYCAKVTYVARRGAEPITEVLCEGDTPQVGGEPVKGPSTAEDDDHEDGHDHEHQ